MYVSSDMSMSRPTIVLVILPWSASACFALIPAYRTPKNVCKTPAKDALSLPTRTDAYQKSPVITKEFAWLGSAPKPPCIQGHCHATERKRTGLQTTGSQLIPHPRFRQARLRTTPFSHAFRPRLPATLFSHAFQPRLSATPSGHVFRRTIWIEDVMYSAELVVPLIFGAVQRRVTNCTFTCCCRKGQTM